MPTFPGGKRPLKVWPTLSEDELTQVWLSELLIPSLTVSELEVPLPRFHVRERFLASVSLSERECEALSVYEPPIVLPLDSATTLPKSFVVELLLVMLCPSSTDTRLRFPVVPAVLAPALTPVVVETVPDALANPGTEPSPVALTLPDHFPSP